MPLKIVMQQYGPQVRQDVISDVLKKNFNDAVREKNLRIAGYPRFEPKEAAENATSLNSARHLRSIPKWFWET